jgi:hypothetical protein
MGIRWSATGAAAATATDSGRRYRQIGTTMITLGIILAIGYFSGLAAVEAVGGIVMVIAILLWILGATERPLPGHAGWF